MAVVQDRAKTDINNCSEFTVSNGEQRRRMTHWRKTGIAPKGYAIEPADGGYSWTVLFGCCISSIIVSNSFVSFGVLLGDIKNTFAGSSVSTLALAPSIGISVASFAGPVAAILMQRYSCRRTIFIGALSTSIGFFLLYFVNDVVLFLVVYGTFIGLGSGLTYPTFPVALSQYFKHHFGIANGFLMAGTGMSKFILAPLTELLREEYGCRGTFLLLAALSMHSCIGVSLLQPPKWHNILVPMTTDDEIANGHDKCLRKCTSSGDADKCKKLTDSVATQVTVEPTEKSKGEVMPSNNGSNVTDMEARKNPEAVQKSNSLQSFIATLDFTLLRWSVFYIGTINNVIMTVSLTFTGILLYPLALDIGVTPMQAALGISTRAIGEIVGRATGPIIRSYFHLDTRLFTIVVFALNGISCAVITRATSLAYFIIAGISSGLVFGCCVGINGQLIMENIGKHRLPSFVGLAALFQGISLLFLGPLLGWIRDVTGTYKNVFLFIGILQFGMVALWAIRPYFRDEPGERKTDSGNKA